MDNNDAGKASLPQKLYFGDDTYLKQIEDSIWKRWFEAGLWNYKDAIRLAVCGPCNAITTCAEHCEKGIREFESYPDDKYDCFHSKLNDLNSQMPTFFHLYESEAWSNCGFASDDAPARIPPAKFIEWALSKKMITVPHEMQNWYILHRPKKETSSKPADITSTPKRRKKKNEITQEEAAALARVEPRTIYNWENGIGAPAHYPGLQSRADFMAFVERRETDKRFRKAARAINSARPAGNMSGFSEGADL